MPENQDVIFHARIDSREQLAKLLSGRVVLIDGVRLGRPEIIALALADIGWANIKGAWNDAQMEQAARTGERDP